MKAKRIDHIAIAVKDLDAAVATYQHNFGLEKVSGGDVPALGIRNAFLQIGDAQIELITPLSEQGPVADFLARQWVRAKEKGMRYIAMNNFQVAADQAAPFEERWRRRRSYLQGAPGFESFQLLRGESHNGTIHYVSHSTWASKEAFLSWTESES